MRLIPLTAAALMLLVAACGDKGNEPGVGGVSRDEAAALNNAAEVLDASPDGLAAPEEAGNDSDAGTVDVNGN